ncbi:MAG: hypothetical protein PF692_04045 [Kiritimatiellae bacterium]|jgi:hypothetical protein|nr:hypothetical protein [Kiritimatiellia bacterium]
MFSQNDRDILRNLAGQLADIAHLPIQEERKVLWQRSNDLDPVRPMIWLTELPWKECQEDMPELRNQCEDTSLHHVENHLKQRIFYHEHLQTDQVEIPYFPVQMVCLDCGYGVEIAETTLNQNLSSIQSHHYEPAIKDMDDIEKIKFPDLRVDVAQNEKNVALINDLFGDLLPPQLIGRQGFDFPIWDHIVRWTGVTEALMDMVMRPDYIHALMRRATDVTLMQMDQLEAAGILQSSSPRDRIGSGATGYTSELPMESNGVAQKVNSFMDVWGFATAQIFGDVSPAMHEEFAINYEIEILERCGLNYYGCCEKLHDRMHAIAKIPRLRKISVSPWCNVGIAAEKAEGKYVFSHKPNPAVVANDAFSLVEAEGDLTDRLNKSFDQGFPCEVILKDISTIKTDIKRPIEWSKMAMKLAKGYE